MYSSPVSSSSCLAPVTLVARPKYGTQGRDHERKSRVHHRLGDLVVGTPLRTLIDRREVVRRLIRFVHILVAGVPVDPDRARVDALGDVHLDHQLEDGTGSLDVDSFGPVFVPGPGAQLEPRCEMEHAIDPHHGRTHRRRFSDVPLHDRDCLGKRLGIRPGSSQDDDVEPAVEAGFEAIYVGDEPAPDATITSSSVVDLAALLVPLLDRNETG